MGNILVEGNFCVLEYQIPIYNSSIIIFVDQQLLIF